MKSEYLRVFKAFFFQKVRRVKKVFAAENNKKSCCSQCGEAKNHAK